MTRRMMRGTDVAVVGAGIAGLSTAHALAERGASGDGVRARPARRGSVRRGVADLPPCARRSPAGGVRVRGARGWRDWEERFGRELLSRDGVVALGPEADRRLRVIHETGGVRAHAIDRAELAERLPPLGQYDGYAMLDEDGGVLRVRAAVEALSGAAGCARLRRGPLGARDAERYGRGARRRRDGRARARRALRGRRHGGAGPRRRPAAADPPPALTCVSPSACATSRPRSWRACSTMAVPSASPPPTATRCRATPPTPSGSARRRPTRTAASSTRPPSRPSPGASSATSPRHSRPRDRALRRPPLPGSELPWSPDGIAVWELGGLVVLAGNNLFKHAPALGRAPAGAALGYGLEPILHPEAKLGMQRQA